jgi:hypothetical protein
MKITSTRVTEVTIAKNESGNYIYHDTGRTVNTGEKAYMVKNEDIVTGAITKVFFENKEKANMFE